MKWPWPPLRPGDVLGIAFVVAVLVIVVFVMVRYPNFSQQSTNAGFGPDWDCKQTGSGEPVCVKKIDAAKRAVGHAPRHCEERSDEAIQLSCHVKEAGLLRFARNDVET